MEHLFLAYLSLLYRSKVLSHFTVRTGFIYNIMLTIFLKLFVADHQAYLRGRGDKRHAPPMHFSHQAVGQSTSAA